LSKQTKEASGLLTSRLINGGKRRQKICGQCCRSSSIIERFLPSSENEISDLEAIRIAGKEDSEMIGLTNR